MVERVVVGPWRVNSYIFSSAKKECIIIDPGGDETEIAARVDVLNMVPVGIVLTHGHVDHVAATGRLKESYEARGYTLPVAIHGSDRIYLGASGMDIHRESLEFLDMDESGFFGAEFPGLPRADIRLKAGDRVFGMDLVVLETPGHTPGSICLYCEREGVLFSGDTIFFDGVGRTDLPGGNERKLFESIAKTIMTLPPETRVFPGHGPFTTVERERRGSSYARVQVALQSRPARPAAAAVDPAKKAAGKPVKKSVKKSAKKSGKKPVKKVVRKPVKKVVKNPAGKAAKKSAKKPAAAKGKAAAKPAAKKGKR